MCLSFLVKLDDIFESRIENYLTNIEVLVDFRFEAIPEA
jgi:hypothetical protein